VERFPYSKMGGEFKNRETLKPCRKDHKMRDTKDLSPRVYKKWGTVNRKWKGLQ